VACRGRRTQPRELGSLDRLGSRAAAVHVNAARGAVARDAAFAVIGMSAHSWRRTDLGGAAALFG
jgi:hypothetical protein